MRTWSRYSLLAALLALAGGASCSGVPAAVGAAAAPAKRASAADAHFMSGMIHHHAQALVMAGWSSGHAASQSVRSLSERITVSQQDEIKLMQQWLGERGEPVPEATPGPMRMTMGGMEHEMLMPGMLSPEQMAELDAARDSAFDRLFLTFMIQHHQGALQMVEELFASYGGGVDDFIYKFASDTFADQGIEIDRMQRMLEGMGAAGR